MRKQIMSAAGTGAADAGWLDLERIAAVEVTSEAPEHPIEAALVAGGAPSGGWRAAAPGAQVVRLRFDEPQRLRRIRLRVDEASRERTQELVLRWSGDDGAPPREIVRQQWTFSPGGATTEIEDYVVDLPGARVLELAIVPDVGRGDAVATLRELRLA